MREGQTAPRFACENGHPADTGFVAKLQQAASLSNENCDRATALARNLSTELRDAEQRINQLEQTNAHLDRARREAETALARLEAEAHVRFKQAKREMQDSVRREVAEAENRVAHLQDELAEAKHSIEQVSADASAR